MNAAIIGSIFEIGKSLISRLIPDPTQRAQAELELLKLQQEGKLRDLEIMMSAIVMEAQSPDRWTSRARPSFLYVIYLMILASIPIGILYIFNPEAAASIVVGMQAWLDAIPEDMWILFGAGYLGYAAARTYEKGKKVAR